MLDESVVHIPRSRTADSKGCIYEFLMAIAKCFSIKVVLIRPICSLSTVNSECQRYTHVHLFSIFFLNFELSIVSNVIFRNNSETAHILCTFPTIIIFNTYSILELPKHGGWYSQDTKPSTLPPPPSLLLYVCHYDCVFSA